MKIAENNVKYCEIMILDQKFHFKKCKVSFKFCLHGGNLVNKFFTRGWVFEQKFSGPGFSPRGWSPAKVAPADFCPLRLSVNFEG